MDIEKLLIIPQKDELAGFLELSQKHGYGFEYNDFFMPALLDNPEELNERIMLYVKAENKPPFSTVHGAFFDVLVFSDDPKICEIAELRVNQSLDVATRLGAEGVIFHTNYTPNFDLESYRSNWVERNVEFWSRKISEYPDVNIYMENMFDTDCMLLAQLGERMKTNPHFGICFDYAHAQVFGDEEKLELWVKTLSPYVKHMHINDNDFQKDLHMALGDGKIDWGQFKAYYEEYFSTASVLLEVTGLEKTKKSLEFLSQIQ